MRGRRGSARHFSEGIVLFVERRPESQPSRELFEAHAKGIAAYMRPSHYVVLEPGAFPLNRVNKTDYVRLSEMALAEVERLRAEGNLPRDTSSGDGPLQGAPA